MSQEVGRGHVEIDTNIDSDKLQRALVSGLSKAGDEATNSFGKRIAAKSGIFKDHGATMGRIFNRGLEDDLRKRLPTLGDRFRRHLTLKVKLDLPEGSMRTFSAAVRTRLKFLEQRLKIEPRIEPKLGPMARLRGTFRRLFGRLNTDLDTNNRHMGTRIGKALSRGFDSALSLLPGRMESLFSGKGGPIGLALGAAIISGVSVSLAPLGAMVSAAILGGVGLGVIAAGIALVRDDPRVGRAIDRLKKNFSDKIKNGPGADIFGGMVARAVDRINAAMVRWAPLVDRMLKAASKFVGPLTNGLIRMIDGFIKPLTRFIESPLMGHLMKEFGDGLARVGQAIGRFFTRFEKNTKAQKGAVKGLRFAFDLLAKSIDRVGEFLVNMSVRWFEWTRDPDGPGPLKSKVDQLAERWRNFKRDFMEMLPAIRGFLDGVRMALDIIMSIFKIFGGATKGVLGWLSDNQDIPLIGHLTKAIGMAWLLNKALKAVGVSKGLAGLGGVGGGAGIAAAGAGVVGANLFPALGKLTDSITKGVGGKGGAGAKGSEAINNLFHGEFTKALANTKEAWRLGWEDMKRVYPQFWASIKAVAASGWNGLKGLFLTSLTGLKNLWNTVWGSIKAHAIGWWNFVVQWVAGKVTSVKNWLIGVLTSAKNLWFVVWNSIKATAVGILNSIVRWVAGRISSVKNWLIGVLSSARNLWNAIWNSIKNFVIGILNSIVRWVAGRISSVRNWLIGVITSARNLWNAIWTSIKNIAIGVLNAIVRWVAGRISSVKNWIVGTMVSIRNRWHEIWNNIGAKTGEILERIRSFVASKIETVRSIISSVLDKVKQKFSDIFNSIKHIVEVGLNNAAAVGARALNGLIGILNKGIGAINGVIGKLGIKARIPEIPKISEPAVQGFRTGGFVRGQGSTTGDKIPAMLSNKEYVINAKAVKRVGVGYLDSINSGPPGFRKGGFGGAAAGALGRVRGGMSYPGIIALARASKIPNNPGSTYRPGSRAGNGNLDYHSKGWAVDFMGYNQDRLSAFFRSLSTLEVIHVSTKTGKNWSAYDNRPGAAVAGHQNHLHVAMSPSQVANPGKSGFNIPGLEFLLKGWGWVKDHMINPVVKKLGAGLPDNGLGWIAQGGANILKANIPGWIKDQFNKIMETFGDLFGGAGGAVSGGAKGVKAKWGGLGSAALKMLGLPQSWLGPMMNLISRESGGNPRAINLSDSNAARGDPSRGLMQTIGATFRAYALPGHTNIYNPLDNMLAGLRYIRSRYGSIFKVQQAVGATPQGYDNGGIWAPGTLGVNASGKPEMVLNAAQAAAFERRIGGGETPLYVTVMLDGEVVAYRIKAAVDENNTAIVNAVKRGISR